MSPEEAVTNAGRDTYSLELALIVGLGVVGMKELPYNWLKNALLRVYQLVFPIYFRFVNEMYLLDSTDWVKRSHCLKQVVLGLKTNAAGCLWHFLHLVDSPLVLCRCRLSVTIHSVLGRIRFELLSSFISALRRKLPAKIAPSSRIAISSVSGLDLSTLALWPKSEVQIQAL